MHLTTGTGTAIAITLVNLKKTKLILIREFAAGGQAVLSDTY